MGEVSRLSPGDFTRFRERSPVPRTNSAGRTCGGAARILAAGSSSWGPGTGLCQVSRRDSRRAGACGRARTLQLARMLQGASSPLQCASSRSNRAESCTNSPAKSQSDSAPGSVVVAAGSPHASGLSASAHAPASRAPRDSARTELQNWRLKNFSLEVFKIFCMPSPGEAIMLTQATEQSLEQCPTQIVAGEFVQTNGHPYALEKVLQLVPAFREMDNQSLPSEESKGGKLPVFKCKMTLRALGQSRKNAAALSEAQLKEKGYSAQDLCLAQEFCANIDSKEKWHTLLLRSNRHGTQLLDEDEWGGKCAPAEVPILVKGTAVAGFGFLSPHSVCTCAACSQSSGSGALEQQRKHDQQLADQRKDAEDRFLRLMRAVEAGLPRTTSEDECRCDRVCGCGGGKGSRCALHFRDTRPLTCVHVTSGNSFSVC